MRWGDQDRQEGKLWKRAVEVIEWGSMSWWDVGFVPHAEAERAFRREYSHLPSLDLG